MSFWRGAKTGAKIGAVIGGVFGAIGGIWGGPGGVAFGALYGAASVGLAGGLVAGSITWLVDKDKPLQPQNAAPEPKASKALDLAPEVAVAPGVPDVSHAARVEANRAATAQAKQI